MFQNNFAIVLIICTSILATCYGRMSFNNLKCTSIDKDFTEIAYCHIKAVNRTYQYMSLKVNLLYKVPINNATLRLQVMKRVNGYKPFLYDVTFDICKFLIKRNNPIGNFFFKMIAGVSNINHSCPYNNDITVEKVSNVRLDHLLTDYLPVPRGDYALYTIWSAFNIPQVNVNIYVKLE